MVGPQELSPVLVKGPVLKFGIELCAVSGNTRSARHGILCLLSGVGYQRCHLDMLLIVGMKQVLCNINCNMLEVG